MRRIWHASTFRSSSSPYFLVPVSRVTAVRSSGFSCCPNACAVSSIIETAALEYFVHGCKWILLSIRNLCRHRRQAGLATRSAQGALKQAGFEQADQTVFPMLDVFSLALAAGLKMLSKFRHRLGQFLNALILRGYRAHDRRVPSVARHHQRQHGQQLLLQPVGAL